LSVWRREAEKPFAKGGRGRTERMVLLKSEGGAVRPRKKKKGREGAE